MTDTLEIFGTEYSGVTGIKATDSNNTTKTYIRPQGTKSITSNGNGIDVAEYASVDVSVSGSSPTLETITKTYTPSTSAITDTITPSIGYDGIEEVDVTVSAVPTATMKGIVNPTLSKSGSSVNSSGLVSIDALVSDTIYPIYSSGYATTGDGVLAYTSGTLTHQLTTKSSSDLEASGSTVTAPAGYYASQATKSVASGTEGTPTASKGTVTNHSVSVTPSVTNTAGYISGGTKTGTAVTVSASELVSGSETKTSNGTYDVTNLASLVVNVSGGSGLEYESGTYTPTENIARPTISFSKTYAKPPAIVMLSDATGTIDTTANTNYAFTFSDYYQLTGCGYPYSSSESRYCLAKSLYKGSTGTGNTTNNTVYVTYNYTTQVSTYTSAYSRYWVTESGFSPYSNSTTRYWRTTRTYKWIAIWI